MLQIWPGLPGQIVSLSSLIPKHSAYMLIASLMMSLSVYRVFSRVHALMCSSALISFLVRLMFTRLTIWLLILLLLAKVCD